MKVVISDATNPNYDSKMSTADAYYRVEAHQLSSFNSSPTGLLIDNALRLLPVTFENAGNCKGVIFNLRSASSAAFLANRLGDVIVTLQENVAGTWTDRATKMLTASQLLNGSTHKAVHLSMLQPFVFDTPYAVDTTPDKWRFTIIQDYIETPLPATRASWALRSSWGGQLMFAAWCDNEVSFDDDDILVVKDLIYIDEDKEFGAIVPTGENFYGISCIICKSDNPAKDEVCKLRWEENPADSYTVKFKGVVAYDSYAGFQIGTKANPIPYDKQARVIFDAAGQTYPRAQITHTARRNNGSIARASFMAYGEKPAFPKTRLAYDLFRSTTVTFFTTNPHISPTLSIEISSGMVGPVYFETTGTLPPEITAGTTYWIGKSIFAGNLYRVYSTAEDAENDENHIEFSDAGSGTHTQNGVYIVEDETDWEVGDNIYTAGLINRNSTSFFNDDFITSIDGKEIRVAQTREGFVKGGIVTNMDAGYGIYIENPEAGGNTISSVGWANHFDMEGVCSKHALWTFTHNITQLMVDPEFNSRILIDGCFWFGNPAKGSQQQALGNGFVSDKGMTVSNCIFEWCRPFQMIRPAPDNWDGYGDGSGRSEGIVDINNIFYTKNYFGGMSLNGTRYKFHHNQVFDTKTNIAQAGLNFGGNGGLFNSEIYNNEYYGAGGAFLTIDVMRGNTWYNDKFDDLWAPMVLRAGSSVIGRLSNGNFGSKKANNNLGTIQDGAFADLEFNNLNTNQTLGYTGGLQPLFISGTTVRYVNHNNTPNFDFIEKAEGNLVRTGTGLADTTARSGFALRFESIVDDSRLEFSQVVPTGNIKDLPLTVGVWCNIKEEAYWSDTHQMPRLTVIFDDGTTAYAEAEQETGWQFIQVSILPETEFGQIDVILSTQTDQTGDDAYVYFDDMSILYPAGKTLDLGNFDLWARAQPVTPSISTLASAQDIWAVDPTTFSPNTVGAKVNKIKKDTGLIPAGL